MSVPYHMAQEQWFVVVLPFFCANRPKILSRDIKLRRAPRVLQTMATMSHGHVKMCHSPWVEPCFVAV